MKKFALLSLIFCFSFVMNPPPIQAGSQLETWCLSTGQNWNPIDSSCSVTDEVVLNSLLIINPGESLTIEEDAVLFIFNQLYNFGNISISGSIENQNYIANNNFLINYGALATGNYALTINNADLYNLGFIPNYGVFVNNAQIMNAGTIGMYPFKYFQNFGVIHNSGLITNESVFNNQGIVNNGGVLENLNYLENTGTINMYCAGIFIGTITEGNPVFFFESCAYMPALP